MWRDRFAGRAEWPGGTSYCVGQLEKGEEGQHEHIQGYLELEKDCYLSTCKSRFSRTAHWEPRKGPRDAAREYCRKPETRLDGPWEHGEWQADRKQGRRSDLEPVVERIRERDPLSEIADKYPIEFIKFHRGIRELSNFYAKKRDPEQPHISVLYFGPPGCGKTSLVSHLYPGAYWKPVQDAWFDGYCGQDVIIYDDFNRGWFSIDAWCRIVDRYECNVQVKGSFVQLANTTSIFTTNTLPSQWYNFEKYGQGRFHAISRRFTKFCAFYTWNKFEEFDTYGDFIRFVDNPGSRQREYDWGVPVAPWADPNLGRKGLDERVPEQEGQREVLQQPSWGPIEEEQEDSWLLRGARRPLRPEDEPDKQKEV